MSEKMCNPNTFSDRRDIFTEYWGNDELNLDIVDEIGNNEKKQSSSKSSFSSGKKRALFDLSKKEEPKVEKSVVDPLKVISSNSATSSINNVVPNSILTKATDCNKLTAIPAVVSGEENFMRQEPERIRVKIDRKKESLTEKKLRRLEKNRLSARECRKRKREAVEELEREIGELESENLRLRLQLQIGEEAKEISNKEEGLFIEKLEHLVNSKAPESDVYAMLESWKERFSDYGRNRRSEIEFHLRNIERLLLPTTTTSVVMRSLSATDVTQPELPQFSTATAPPANITLDNNSITKNLEPEKLFRYLVNFLQVSPEQAAALNDSRYVARDLDDILAQSISMLAELHKSLTHYGQELESEFDSVQAILSPTQTAKFFIWISHNSACMHMLNELWKKNISFEGDK